MSEEQLKPCPFCGGDAELHHVGNYHTKKRLSVIECKTFGCFAIAKVGAIKHDFDWMDGKVTEQWNKRAYNETDIATIERDTAEKCAKISENIVGNGCDFIEDVIAEGIRDHFNLGEKT